MQTRRVNLLRIIDGDTVVVAVNRGFLRGSREVRIRLYGMDAPESNQKFGPESAAHLKRIIGGRRRIWMDEVDTDHYGRTVGLIYRSRGKSHDSYNLRMVREGMAEAYMAKGADRAIFEKAEQDARARRTGIWRQRNYQTPSDFRREAREGGRRRARILLRLAILAAVAAAVAAGVLHLGGLIHLPGLFELPEVPGMPALPGLPSLPDPPSLPGLRSSP